jgi:serine/threonine-protein kinase
LREARILAGLSHPHVVTAYDVGTETGLPGGPIHYMAMEKIEGKSLDGVVATLDLTRRLELLRQVALGLGHVHEKGVVHRDLKPENILVDDSGRAIVTDFGLATGGVDHTTLTRAGTVMGTVTHMAPEQVEANLDAIDARTDVWALGVLLYELLTDTLPFRGQSPEAVMSQITRRAPKSPRKISPDVPSALDAICLKMLTRNPVSRYEHAGEVAKDLGRYIEGRPVHAQPTTTLARLRLWGRRNRLASIALFLCGLFFVFWVGAWVRIAGLEAALESEREKKVLERSGPG